MICNLSDLDLTTTFDICIVGGGAAGLTIATALGQGGLRVLVLEAGDRKQTDTAQEHFRGELADPGLHSPLHSFRVRALGGTSQIWGGRCVPFDPIDFEDRPWVPVPGWPIPYSAVLPFYERAQEAAEAGPFDYDPRKPLVPGLDGEQLETTLERFSRPTDFSQRYGEVLERSTTVSVVLNATVTRIQLDPAGKRVEYLQVTAVDGTRVQIEADDYVLACGGFENTRLLLASNDVQTQGIGNQSDWLGRCYMSHTSATLGTVTFTGPPKAILGDYERDSGGVYLRRRIGVTAAAQRRLKSLNFAFRLHLQDIIDPIHGDPVLSFLYHARYFVKYEYSRKSREAVLTRAQHVKHFTNVLLHPIRLTRFVVFWIHKRYLSERRIPSIVLFSRKNRYALEFHAEQAPNPQSRVTLGEERDAFGMPRLKIDWQVTPLDIETIKRSYHLLASELERTGTGYLEFDESKVEPAIQSEGAYGGHHIGTARMSARPEDGVVDPNCRVHGVANLFVSGAAVMPTSSQANPTLTVLALGFRLADLLQSRATARAATATLAEGAVAA